MLYIYHVSWITAKFLSNNLIVVKLCILCCVIQSLAHGMECCVSVLCGTLIFVVFIRDQYGSVFFVVTESVTFILCFYDTDV